MQDRIDSRTRELVALAQDLRKEYQDTQRNSINFRKMSQDRGIIFLDNQNLEGSYTLRGNLRTYIVIGKYFFQAVRQFSTGHEFGHIYLGHGPDMPLEKRDKEANLFSEELTKIAFERYSDFFKIERCIRRLRAKLKSEVRASSQNSPVVELVYKLYPDETFG